MFTPQEAEQILREGWSGAQCVGGFQDANFAAIARNELCDVYGAQAVAPYRLLGQVGWSTYEEGGEITLLERVEDGSLWSINRGHSVMVGDYGLDLAAEVHATTMEEWLEEVASCEEHERTYW